MEPPVLVNTHEVAGERYVGQLTLNSPGTLNALSLEMINSAGSHLDKWAADEGCVCVLINGAGDRAFCAGGDIQALYKAMSVNHEAGRSIDDYPGRFFEAEYRLDYQLHTYPKPVIAYGDGFIMGGGLGVFSACRYRIATDKTRLAMPEITIGLFPDAGASYILGRLTKPVALFLGLTGSQVRAGECLYLSLATHYLQSPLENLLAELIGSPWKLSSNEVVLQILDHLSRPAAEADAIKLVEQSINANDDLLNNIAEINKLGSSHSTFERAISRMQAGCPVSLGLVNEQVIRCPGMSIADILQMELSVATHCARYPDFHEGIRALIIDKDTRPNWSCGYNDKAFENRVAVHFEPPWQINPLIDLGD